mgnify:CR=1 FL=1
MVLDPLSDAVKTGSMHVSEGLDERVADLFESAVAIWHAAKGLEEAPTREWLQTYLGQAHTGMYQVRAGGRKVKWLGRAGVWEAGTGRQGRGKYAWLSRCSQGLRWMCSCGYVCGLEPGHRAGATTGASSASVTRPACAQTLLRTGLE